MTCAIPKSGAMTNALQYAPFRKAAGPSLLQIFLVQSIIPEYVSSFTPLCNDCNLVFITSQGLTATAAMLPAAQPARNDTKKGDFSSGVFCPSLFKLANRGK